MEEIFALAIPRFFKFDVQFSCIAYKTRGVILDDPISKVLNFLAEGENKIVIRSYSLIKDETSS